MEREATLSELEKITRVSFKTLKKRLEGLKPVRRQGLEIFYDLKQALPLIFAPKNSDVFDLTRERARLAKVQADKIVIETERLRGSLVDVEAWHEEFSKFFVSLKDSLKNMGLRLADQLSQCKTREEAYVLVNRYTTETLEELAKSASMTAYENSKEPIK